MIVRKKGDLHTLLSKIRKRGKVAVDTETHATKKYPSIGKKDALILDRARLTVIPLYLGEYRGDEPIAYTLPYVAVGNVPALPTGPLMRFLRSALEDPKIEKIFHNSNYDRSVFRNHGLEVRNWRDTMIEGWCLNENLLKGLKERAVSLGMFMRKTDSVRFDDPEDLREYAEEDVIATWRLAEVHDTGTYEGAFRNAYADADLSDMWFGRNKRTKFMKKHHDSIEKRVADVVLEAETRGVRVDKDYLDELTKELQRRIDQVEEEFFAIAGRPVNMASPKDLQEVFFDNLEYPVLKKGKTGPSLDAPTLTLYVARGYSEARTLLEWRGLSTLRKMYLNEKSGLAAHADENGHIHTSFGTVGTVTGRFTSSIPNLQQIPKKADTTSGIRKAFIPKDDAYVLIDADYSGFELRLMATFSKDEEMIRVLKQDPNTEGGDLHQLTADSVGVSRAIAKALNFGLLYGMGYRKLAHTLTVQGIPTTEAEAKKYIRGFFDLYKKIDPFRQALFQFHREHGYIRTLAGRYRRVQEMEAHSFGKRSAAERTCINNLIQGSAADCIKSAMIRCDEDELMQDCGAEFLIQVHDELLFQVPKRTADKAAARLEELMMMPPIGGTIVSCPVPFFVDAEILDSWGGERVSARAAVAEAIDHGLKVKSKRLRFGCYGR